MRKLISIILASIILSTGLGLSAGTFGLTTHAEDLKELEFSVTKYLTVPGAPDADGKPTSEQPQSYFTGGDDSQQTPFPVTTFILDTLNLLVKVAGTIAVFMLIITGFVMMFSQGNQNALEKAKSMFMYTIIGLLVIFLSYVMVTLVQGIFTN